ncbi:hypothetical protein BH20ACI4_BH20ACI4_24900 [soil metagenome]
MKKNSFALCLFFLTAFSLSVFAQNYSIERYLNIRSAGSPAFSPDAKRIAFLTNITGTNQIWFVDAGGGYPEQITSFDDNISFVEWLPDGKGLIFGKAIGGNENAQFFHLSDDGSNIKQLTADEKTRHNFGTISKDGNSIFYTSNKRDKNWFDVYRMEIASGKEEMLLQDDSSNSVAAVSGDGSRVVVSRSSVKFSLDNDLYIFDNKTKQTRHLTPHDEATQYGDVHFLPDNKTLVFGTNDKREFYNLAEMSLKGNTYQTASEIADKVRVIDNTNWDLDATTVSPRGDFFAYTSNREGFSELYLRKIETSGKPLISNVETKTETVALPAKGIVGGLEFSDDGTKLAFTFAGAKYNTDIWIYDLPTKKLTQITKSSRSGIPQDSFVEPQLIKFKTFDGREISAWYYVPANISGIRVKGKSDKTESTRYFLTKSDELESNTVSADRFPVFTVSENPHAGLFPINNLNHGETIRATSSKYTDIQVPAIISVHGGPEGQERPGFNPLYQYYLSRGYAILATNVRGSTGYGKTFSHLDDVEKREDSVKDLASAVEWLKTSGGADPKRIAVMGGSYGGYMTMAAITLYPDLFAAAVNTVGIVNWETFLKNTSGYRRRQREVEYGMLDKDLDFLRKISPMAKVDKIKTPLFVIHGKNDPRVPYTEAEQVVKALKDRGAIVEYKLYDDEGHGISKLKNRLDLYPRVADFLDKYMK